MIVPLTAQDWALRIQVGEIRRARTEFPQVLLLLENPGHFLTSQNLAHQETCLPDYD